MHVKSIKDSIGTAPASGWKPEFIRVSDARRIFGIGRTKIYELPAEGRIKSVSLRERGQARATRLIGYDSLLAYLEERATGGNENS